MALKAKVVNKVQTNDKGLVEGVITNVLEVEERFQDSKGNSISHDDYLELKAANKKPVRYDSQFEFQIKVEGSQKPIVYRIWTGQTLNDAKHEKLDKSEDYNTLTRLMLQLEVINESGLKNLESLSSVDVQCVEGFKINFQLEPSKKTKGFSEIKLNSIKLVKN